MKGQVCAVPSQAYFTTSNTGVEDCRKEARRRFVYFFILFFFIFSEKGGSHTGPESYERRPCSFSSQRIGNEKLPEKPGEEGMRRRSQQTELLLQRKLPHIRAAALFLIWICSFCVLAQYSRDSC